MLQHFISVKLRCSVLFIIILHYSECILIKCADIQHNRAIPNGAPYLLMIQSFFLHVLYTENRHVCTVVLVLEYTSRLYPSFYFETLLNSHYGTQQRGMRQRTAAFQSHTLRTFHSRRAVYIMFLSMLVPTPPPGGGGAKLGI